jgi:hypothetical protein
VAVDRRLLMRCLTLAFILVVGVSSQVKLAAGSAPVIVDVRNDTHGGNPGVPLAVAILLTINYVPSSPGGYVDQAEVTYDGTVQPLYTIDKSIQTTNPFQVRLEIGTSAGGDEPHSASVRVHSTADGWSASSATVPVPEFPVIPVVTFIILMASLLTIRHRQRSQASAPKTR